MLSIILKLISVLLDKKYQKAVFLWSDFFLPRPLPCMLLVRALTRLRKKFHVQIIFGVLGCLDKFLFKMVSFFFIPFKSS